MQRPGSGHNAHSYLHGSAPARIPVSTYRLQLNASFTFKEAIDVVPYLSELGITDVYCSPYLKATRGSMHCYDVIDHSEINPELGTMDDLRILSARLRSLGMGLIMDIVPNHMSIDSAENKWWMDVLENARSSPYSSYFDIDWHPVKEELEEKVILPILGRPYGEALESLEITLSYNDGSFFINYYDNHLPVDPCTYISILEHGAESLMAAAGEGLEAHQEFLSITTGIRNLPGRTETDPVRSTERLREKEILKRRIAALYEKSPEFRKHIDLNISIFNGIEGATESFDLLDALLCAQAYRLTYWQVATAEINYRRFFDINSLAAIRCETLDVFMATHALVFEHVREGIITGLRVDHPDGLHDPSQYFARLQSGCMSALTSSEPVGSEGFMTGMVEARKTIQADERQRPHSLFYVVGEKILIGNERLPLDWAVCGTTGYAYMNSVNGLSVQKANEKAMSAAYSRFIRRGSDFSRMLYDAKKHIMNHSMAGEINVLGHDLNRISERHRHYRDFTLNSLTDAVIEATACFPVYRTYISERGVSDTDIRYIKEAIAKARRMNHNLSDSVFDFLQSVLLTEYPSNADEATRAQWLAFTMKFQQMTGPIMAKGMEDTLFYIYNRMSSLNEVGADPNIFGISAKEFHNRNSQRLQSVPHTLIATSTHDSKRSEDVRARINVLSEIPHEWAAHIRRWSRLNSTFKTSVHGRRLPSRNEEYLLYQTLIGAWPLNWPADRDAFVERIKNYMIKTAREAKVETSWLNPDAEHEAALVSFIEMALTSMEFTSDIDDVVRRLLPHGLLNSLSQCLLKITSPGVPDFYQGTELWNFRLVDPDNRIAVDYKTARTMLASLKSEEDRDINALLSSTLKDMSDGRAKLFLTYKALNFRRQHAELYQSGEYVPLETEGPGASRIIAFARVLGNEAAITVVARFMADVNAQGESSGLADTTILLPERITSVGLMDVITGRAVIAEDGRMNAASALKRFPVALIAATGENDA